MTYLQSAVHRHSMLLHGATIAAHSNYYEFGFRQRDLRRMIEFSVNWAYPELDESGIPFDSTQIRRFVEQLVRDGLARKKIRSKQPHYKLTRLGLLEMVSSIVDRGFLFNKDEFFYLYFIVRDYQKGLRSMINREGKELTYGQKLELENLLDSRNLLENQLSYARRELKKLEKRMQDQVDLAAFAAKAIRESISFEDLTQKIDTHFPFCFNGTVPFSQFAENLRDKDVIWEITQGCLKRRQHVWKPAYEALELHIEQMEDLVKEEEREALSSS